MTITNWEGIAMFDHGNESAGSTMILCANSGQGKSRIVADFVLRMLGNASVNGGVFELKRLVAALRCKTVDRPFYPTQEDPSSLERAITNNANFRFTAEFNV